MSKCFQDYRLVWFHPLNSVAFSWPQEINACQCVQVNESFDIHFLKPLWFTFSNIFSMKIYLTPETFQKKISESRTQNDIKICKENILIFLLISYCFMFMKRSVLISNRPLIFKLYKVMLKFQVIFIGQISDLLWSSFSDFMRDRKNSNLLNFSFFINVKKKNMFHPVDYGQKHYHSFKTPISRNFVSFAWKSIWFQRSQDTFHCSTWDWLHRKS